MITTIENNIQVDFLNSNLIHISLKGGAVLSTQLLRELNVVSMVRNGKYSNGYIFTVKDREDIQEDACRTCRKVDRISSFIKVAVVCSKQCTRKSNSNLSEKDDKLKTSKLFNDFSSALFYVNNNPRKDQKI